jgi:hypothetical protein
MATMGFQPYPGPIADRIVYLPEAATQTFKRGDLVILSSGKVAVATDDLDVWGVAMVDATGTTDTSLPIYTIHASDKFIAEASTTTAVSNQGTNYALVMTSGSMAVNPGSTTTPGFVIESLDPRDGATTGAGGRVIGRFAVASDGLDSIGG